MIASRQLTDRISGEVISIEVFAPEEDADHEGEWVCRVELLRNRKPEASLEGRGGDSLQALINGLGAVRPHFKERSRRYRWWKTPGYLGLPLMIMDDDPDFLALVEHLIGVEVSRQMIWRRLLSKSKTDSEAKPEPAAAGRRKATKSAQPAVRRKRSSKPS